NCAPASVSPLNHICYMWWDVFIISGNSEDDGMRPLNEACLAVMEQCLALSNVAVLEGALHGLGHFVNGYPEQCREAIDRFVAERGSELPPQLHRYGMAARTGAI